MIAYVMIAELTVVILLCFIGPAQDAHDSRRTQKSMLVLEVARRSVSRAEVAASIPSESVKHLKSWALAP